jgi:epoxyqueuosine reductase QueG
MFRGYCMSILEDIRGILIENGASLVGFANIKGLNLKVRDEFSLGISIAVALDPKIIKGITKGPTIEYYKEYNRVNSKLDYLSDIISSFIVSKGYKSEYWGTTNSRIYSHHLTDLPHKTMATLSGLGWIGKNSLLITIEFGSAVRLTTVLTDIDEQVEDRSVKESLCGNCSVCVNVCPGNAPSGKNWNINLFRDNFFDPDLCRATARKLAFAAGIEDTICGICISNCPHTVKYIG